MSTINIEVTEEHLRILVINYINELINVRLSTDDVEILVKSKQNYKAEWESAAFKAKINKVIKI